MGRKVLWQELRRTEFQQAAEKGAVVVIPVASTEQHGDHLPVNTDACDCFEIAKRAAQAIDEFPVLVSPVVWTGYSPYHMGYPGTISLKFGTLVELLTEIAVSIHTHGFKKMIFLNGHGGNETIVAAMRVKLSSEEHISRVVGFTWWDISSLVGEMEAISEADKGSIGHAGELETSMQLYLQPELVERGAAAWATGVIGDPAAGTREKGERLIGAAVNALVKVLREYHSAKLPTVLGDKGLTQGFKTIPDSWRTSIKM